MKRAGFRISRRFAAATERRSGMPEVGLRANGAAAWDDWAVKAITYLSPGIPLDLYATIAHHLADALDEPVELTSDARFSGPSADEPNPLTDGDVDLAFICGPSYLRLADEVQLVAAAPVFDDPRTQGRPEYFAEVVVAADRIERSLDETGRRPIRLPRSGVALGAFGGARPPWVDGASPVRRGGAVRIERGVSRTDHDRRRRRLLGGLGRLAAARLRAPRASASLPCDAEPRSVPHPAGRRFTEDGRPAVGAGDRHATVARRRRARLVRRHRLRACQRRGLLAAGHVPCASHRSGP